LISNALTTPTVCCLILTFNRLPALKTCLQRVQTQTRPPEIIHIVDNGSREDTVRFLDQAGKDDSSIVVSSLAENRGPAGGYAYGLKWAVEKQFTYIWVMDDDVFADVDCLEKLLQHLENEDDRIVYPRVFDKDERPANYPAWVGVLIPSSVVKLAGLPIDELFWWTEDTEYLQWRLPNVYGIRPLISPNARVNHGVDDGKEKAAWKYYYEVRNTIYYRSYIQKGHRIRRIRKTLLAVAKPMMKAALFETNKLKKLRLSFLGIYDGVFCRLGKRIDPEKTMKEFTR
jgi:rhamnopyranosyl-N-acetylglucosaminyl-diphospho-decaprenol beta-1,3/1,4-galactofuranosyltransferase